MVIENNFTGTGTLKLKMNFFENNFINCTSSTIKGTVSSPPDAKATITSWSTEGCAIYRKNKNVGSATVKVTTPFPAVEAVSLTKLYLGEFRVEATFQIGGSTCKPDFTVLANNPSYLNGATTNKFESFPSASFIDRTFPLPEVCEFSSGYEPSEVIASFPNPQFEVSEKEVVEEGEFFLRNTNSAGSPDLSFHYGLSTDMPISGDWNGDGRDTIGVYRSSNRSFYLRNTNSAGAPDYSFTYGLKAGTPVVGDWDGDGDETIGLYDTSTGYWYLNQANDGSGAELEFNFGANGGGDIPVTGDWNGDGKTTIGVYRPSIRTFYLRNSNSSGSADYSFTYGLKVGTPVAADWNGDGGETIGLWDTETGWWYPNEANDGSGAEAEFIFGAKGDKPITGDWDADKDGTIGLFRP